MTKGVITYTNKRRFIDHIALLADRLRVIKSELVYEILDDANENVGGIYRTYGWWPIVRFLGWASDIRDKGTYKVTIEL